MGRWAVNTDGRWAVDANDWARETRHKVREVLAREPSARQNIEILNLERFGPSLWIDGWPQFSWLDEHCFHQLETRFVLARHQNPERVLILGGADLLAASRVLMRRGVKWLKIADWDMEVRNQVLAYIPAVEALGVHNDPRVDFNEETDVGQYLPKADSNQFDVVIGDLVDVESFGQIVPNFLHHIVRILRPGGAFVTQAGELSLAEKPLKIFRNSLEEMKRYFKSVGAHAWPIESFSYVQPFLWGWKDRDVSPVPPTESELRRDFDCGNDRPFYTPAIQQAAFTLAQAIAK